MSFDFLPNIFYVLTRNKYRNFMSSTLQCMVMEIFEPCGEKTDILHVQKQADQLRSNCKADKGFCFRYTDRTIPLLSKSKISSLLQSTVLVQLGLCQTCLETALLVFS